MTHAASRPSRRIAATFTALLVTGVASLPAQGSPYAFAERTPRTRLEALVGSTLPSLVKIHGASGLQNIEPFATGVIVSADGHVLTLDQVMIQPGQTRVVLADGSVHLADLLPPEPRLGVRLLKIDPAAVTMPLRPLEPSAEVPDTGRFVVSIGNAFRLAEFSEKLSACFGVVSGTATTGLRYRLAEVAYDGRLILTDAPNNPGHGGGALVTLDGRWIGLNARIIESTETNTLLSAAIPTADLHAYLDRWIRGIVPDPAITAAAETTPGHHGIRLFDRGGRRSPPAYVERIDAASPAATLGLRRDDMIVRIDERSVRSCAEFADVMRKHGPGKTVTLTWKRGETVLQGKLTLTEAR